MLELESNFEFWNNLPDDVEEGIWGVVVDDAAADFRAPFEDMIKDGVLELSQTPE